jgi:hypothetical protein
MKQRNVSGNTEVFVGIHNLKYNAKKATRALQKKCTEILVILLTE